MIHSLSRIKSNRQIHTRDWAMLKCRICLIVPILSLLVVFSGCTVPDDSPEITELVLVGVLLIVFRENVMRFIEFVERFEAAG